MEHGFSAMATRAARAVTATPALSEMMNEDYRVTCGMEIENWTGYPLTRACVFPKGGKVPIPPSSILPLQHGIMMARKTGMVPTGSYGTVSWLVEGLNIRVIVMWSAPFNFDFHSNCLAVGFYNASLEHPNGDEAFTQMYEGDSDPRAALQFERRSYPPKEIKLDPVACRAHGLVVEGAMSNTHKAVVKILIRPENMHGNHASPSVRNLLRTNEDEQPKTDIFILFCSVLAIMLFATRFADLGFCVFL